MKLVDWQIADLANSHGMIEPFVGHQVKEGAANEPLISYGLSSVGYDCQLAEDVYVLPKRDDRYYLVFDPKNAPSLEQMERLDVFLGASQNENDHRFVLLPPHSYALGHSVEYFRLPDDVSGTVFGKSTYVRCGVVVTMTPLEPGWEGQITLEFANCTDWPVRLYVNEGICQIEFSRIERPSKTYRDLGGKYQGQRGVTPARIYDWKETGANNAKRTRDGMHARPIRAAALPTEPNADHGQDDPYQPASAGEPAYRSQPPAAPAQGPVMTHTPTSISVQDFIISARATARNLRCFVMTVDLATRDENCGIHAGTEYVEILWHRALELLRQYDPDAPVNATTNLNDGLATVYLG